MKTTQTESLPPKANQKKSMQPVCLGSIAAFALLLATHPTSSIAAPSTAEDRAESVEVGFSMGAEYGRWGLLGGSGTDSRTWFAAAVSVATKEITEKLRFTFDFGFAVQADPIGEYGVRMFDSRFAWELFLVDDFKQSIHWSILAGGSTGLEILAFGMATGRFVLLEFHVGSRMYLFGRAFLQTGIRLQLGVSLTTINDSYAWHIPLSLGIRFS